MHQQHELHAYQSKLNEVLLFEAHFFHGNNLKASLRRIQHLASRHLVMIERVRNVRKAKGQRRGKNHKHRRGNGTGSHGSDDSSNNDPYNTSQDDNSKSTSEIGDMHQHPNSDTNTMESIPEVQQQQQHTASAHPSSPLRDDVQFGGVHNIKMEKTLHKIQTMYMMRCLRVREVRHRILTHLNYFRSIQKRLAIDEGLFHATKKTWKHPTRKDKEKKVDRSDDNQKKHNNHNITNKDNNDTSNNAKSRTNEGHTSMDTKKDIPLFPEELLHDADHTGPNLPQFDRDIEPRDDAYSVQDDGSIIVWDAVMGVPVLYDVAEKDMKHLERHLLRTATAFTKRFDEEREREARKREGVSAAHSSSDRENNKRAQTHGDKKTDGKDTRTDSTDKEKRRHHHRDHKLHDWQRMEKAELEVGGLDVWAVLCSLYESESEYQIAKRRLLETYFEAYQHCIDLTQQQRLAQKMIDLMAARPRLDLSPDSTSYATMYALETRYMAELADFLSEAMDFQRSEDRKHGQVGQAWMEHLNDTQDPSVRKMFLTSSSERRVGLLEFVPSLYKVLDVAEAFEACVEGVFKSLVLSRAAYLPKTLVKLKLRTLKLALESFRKHKHEFSPFPKSKHFSTVDYLNSSFMFSNPYMASHQLLLSATEREREINNNYYEQQASKSECKIQIYFNFLEVMSIRRRLLLHLYETVILTSQYIQQARRLKVDSARTIMDVAAIQGGNLLINNPRSELGLLAMMECSKHLPGAALKIIQDVKRLVLNQSDSLRVLRVALQMQVAHARVLSVVVQLHAMLMRFPQSRENPMRNVQRQVREKARKHELVHAIIKNQKVGGGGEGGSSAGDNNNVDTQAGKEGRKGGGEGAFRNQLPTMGDDYRYGESSSSMRVGHLTSSLFINLAMVKWKAKETVAFEPTASFPARYAEKMVATLAPDIYVLEVLALYDKYNTLHASSSGVFAEGDDGSPVGYIAYDRLSRSHDRGGETTLPLIQHLLHDVPSYVPMNKEAGEDFDAYAASSSLTKFMRQRMHQRRGAVSSSKEQTNKLRLVATSHVGMNRMAFSLFFHLPRLGTLLRLLRVKRAHFRPEFLRRDLLCRKVMYDVLRLSLSLSSCEQLSVYYDTPLRIAELAAHRIDYIKNELDAMPQEATLKDAYEMLVSERNILWYRHLLFTRLVYETSIVRGDYKGLEAYVKVTSRITQHEPIANKRNLFITPDLVGFIPSSVYHDLSVLYLQFTHQKERVKMDDIMAKESSFLARTVAQNVKQWQSDDFKTETNRSKRMEHNLLAAVQLGTIFDAYFLDRFSSLYNDQLSVLSSSSSSAFMDGSNISGSTNSNGKGGNNSARDRNGKRVSFAAAHGSSGCAGMQTRSDPRSGTGGGLGSATIDYSAYDIPEDLEHWQEVQHGAGIVKEAFAHCLDSRSEYKRAIDIVESEILVNVNRERQQLFSSTGKVRYSKLLSLETTMRSLQVNASGEEGVHRVVPCVVCVHKRCVLL